MNNRALQAVPLMLLLLLVLLTYWLDQVVQPGAHRGDGKNRHDPDIIIDNFTAQKLSPLGDVQYVLSAKKMQHFADDNSSLLEQLSLVATPPNQPKMTAIADQGRLLDDGDTVIIEGNVKLQNEAGGNTPSAIIRTARMTIRPDEGFASSDDGVIVETSNSTLTARRFEMNNQTHNIKLTHLKGVLQKGTR